MNRINTNLLKSIFLQACHNGDAATVRSILNAEHRGNIILNVWDEWMPLHTACIGKYPSLDVVKLLVKFAGEEIVTATNANEETPLLRLCKFGSSMPPLDVVEFMIKIGGRALVNTSDRFGDTAMRRACVSSEPSFPLIKILLESGDCDDWDEIAGHMIHNRTKYQGTPILQLFMTTGAPPRIMYSLIHEFDDTCTIADTNGRYPVHTAIETGLPWHDGTRKLVEHFGDTGNDGNPGDGKTPPQFLFAISGNRYHECSVLELLRDPVTDLHPFMQAAACKRYDLSSVFELLRMDPESCITQKASKRQRVE